MKKAKFVKKTWVESFNGQWFISSMEDRIVIDYGKDLKNRIYCNIKDLESLEISIKAILDFYAGQI